MEHALGQVYSFNGATFGAGPASTSFTVGTIGFEVNSSLADISPGFFNVGVDGCYDSAGNPVVPTFETGPMVPEPITMALLLFGWPFSLSLWRERRQRAGETSS